MGTLWGDCGAESYRVRGDDTESGAAPGGEGRRYANNGKGP